MNILVQSVTAEQVRPLRLSVLRPGRPFEETIYPCDALPETFHAAAYLEDEIVAVCTIHPAVLTDLPEMAGWQMRGVAAAESARRLGAGRAVVELCLEHARRQGGELSWCNAREVAFAFYEALGFAKIGPMFNTPYGGPHSRMWRKLNLNG